MRSTRSVAGWQAGLYSVVLVTIGVFGSAAAQETTAEEPRAAEGLLRVIEMQVRPEAVTEWTRLQREELIPAQLAGGYAWVDVWRSGGAGNPYFRSIVVPLRSLAELDEISVFEQALGPERAQQVLERHRELVASITTRIVRPRPDLGFGSRPAQPNVGVLSTVTVANGRTQEFEDRLRTSVAHELREANVASFRVGQILYGGEGSQYFALLDFENFEQVARGHPTALEWALGPVGIARLADEDDSPVVRIERTILQYDRTLSGGTRED